MKITKLKKLTQLVISVTSLCIAAPALSNLNNELNEEIDIYCKKMNQCYLADVPSNNAVKQMIEATLMQTCQTMRRNFAELSSGLQTEALACVKSMNAITCEVRENETEDESEDDEFETPECKQFDESLEGK